MTSIYSNDFDSQPNVTVLLVEDDRPLLEFFLTVLRRDGYTVFPTGNGIEALDIAKNRQGERIDILFTDVAMPYMSGIQLASKMKDARPDIRVLLTSALPEEEVSDRCGPNNKMDFLAKPFSISELSNKIRTLSVLSTEDQPGKS